MRVDILPSALNVLYRCFYLFQSVFVCLFVLFLKIINN